MRTSPRNCSLCGNSFYSGTAQSSKMAIGTTGDFAKAYFNAHERIRVLKFLP